MIRAPFAFFVAVLGLLCLPNMAAAEPPGPAPGVLNGIELQTRAAIAAHIQRRNAPNQPTGVAFADLSPDIRTYFNHVDIDGNGTLEPADLDARFRLEFASRRAQFIQQKMAFDLDGDGRITREELKLALRKRAIDLMRTSGSADPAAVTNRLEALIAAEMQLDTNGDGAITLDEILVAFEATELKRSNAAQKKLRAELSGLITALDRDRDGKASFAEFEAAFKDVFAKLDTNSDGFVTEDELGAAPQPVPFTPLLPLPFTPLLGAPITGQPPLPCNLPKVPPAPAKLAVIGIYEGKALATVRLGTETEETTVADVFIEAGSEPLYVVLSSHRPTIWRFTGATDRVAAVVASATRTSGGQVRIPATEPVHRSVGGPLAGVIGIPRERVSIPPGSHCVPSFYERDKAATQIKALGDALGRTVDVVVGAYGATTVQLPSGIEDRASAMPGARAAPNHAGAVNVWKEFLRFNPAGLIEIDPAAVVSHDAVQPYTVLPREPGLAQLVAEGVMVLEPDHLPFENVFLVTRATRFPAGLHGAHSVQFIIARGVLMPEGDPGHSCVYSEETGKPIGSNMSHCGNERTPRRLAALASPPPRAGADAKPQVIRQCMDAKSTGAQFCIIAPDDQQRGPNTGGAPVPTNLQFVEPGTGAKRQLLPEGTLVADMPYTGKHGLVVAIAKDGTAGSSPRLRLALLSLKGDVHEISLPDFDEVYSALPEGDALIIYARTGETFSQLRIDLMTQTGQLVGIATRAQAEAVGHRKDGPLGRSDRMLQEKTFPGYGGRELSASCMGLHGCLRQFLENDTDGDGRLSPADRKRLAWSTFDGKRNKLLSYEVDEVLGERIYLEGVEVFIRIGTDTRAVFMDHNSLEAVSERPAAANEAVQRRR